MNRRWKCDRCGIKRVFPKAGKPDSRRCDQCRARHQPRADRSGRSYSATNKRDLRVMARDSFEEANPGRRFTGRQWKRVRRLMRREERAL